MQIVTWNVNSLKVRLPQVLEWLAANPDVTALCLQETKMEDVNFPRAEIEAAGFHVVFAGQKTYNGVAIIAREALSDVVVNIPGFDDHQVRLIAATVKGVRLVCAYIPNGQSLDSEKYPYKLAWLEALTQWLKTEMASHEKLALLGDYNIAPLDIDVHDPAKWVGQVLVSEPERAAFQALLDLGLTDSYRLFDQPEKSFSWWDYRGFGFRKNAGMRIDHILLSEKLVPLCSACVIDREPRKNERPSDHTPVIASLAI
ncbi:exodeoxyribonuclease III [Iodobacter fluviatilis]|uniref:Exodeoxyribonuclease III n=1 Tax=Iodobacter fluviatilis TaxID=537 RepID=A0A377Q427_9NEIS|nr:exodeoxyribonuclease III [Iodobacter fluviatilis]TCU90550.1 exodeoxyribonuclease-3 [Iodobacter fluviatilis]STQ89577.1 Exodeoxyribonuclease III [Iodobacter fluviatilis]